jgi:hypothetical protein
LNLLAFDDLGVLEANTRRGRPPAAQTWILRVSMSMPFSRLAWIATVLVAVLTALLLLLAGYTGYAVLSLAIGASAAINLT